MKTYEITIDHYTLLLSEFVQAEANAVFHYNGDVRERQGWNDAINSLRGLPSILSVEEILANQNSALDIARSRRTYYGVHGSNYDEVDTTAEYWCGQAKAIAIIFRKLKSLVE